ncbi:MAG: FtsQ-type POTRA domain-containing protein [Actinomycetota bacterium]|nr:FtsQ-type POTRA domain-containing protein [Actinomycetota bacterium]
MVEGATRSGVAAVQAAAAIHRGRAMTDVDGVEASKNVTKLPWVLRTDVVREWPATVRIRVVERRPAAVTQQDGAAWALVDRVGRVLAPAATPPPGLVIVDGVPPAGAPGTQLVATAHGPLEVAAQLPPGLVPRVEKVTLGADGVELRLKPLGVVQLGDATAVADKLRAAQTVLAAVDGRTVANLDVRIPATPVLTRL